MDVIHTVKVNRPVYSGTDMPWIIHDQLNARRTQMSESSVPPNVRQAMGDSKAAFFHARWIAEKDQWELIKKVHWRYW